MHARQALWQVVRFALVDVPDARLLVGQNSNQPSAVRRVAVPELDFVQVAVQRENRKRDNIRTNVAKVDFCVARHAFAVAREGYALLVAIADFAGGKRVQPAGDKAVGIKERLPQPGDDNILLADNARMVIPVCAGGAQVHRVVTQRRHRHHVAVHRTRRAGGVDALTIGDAEGNRLLVRIRRVNRHAEGDRRMLAAQTLVAQRAAAQCGEPAWSAGISS